jgi:hypothetical protein
VQHLLPFDHRAKRSPISEEIYGKPQRVSARI